MGKFLTIYYVMFFVGFIESSQWLTFIHMCYREKKKKEKRPSVGYFQLVNTVFLLIWKVISVSKTTLHSFG